MIATPARPFKDALDDLGDQIEDFAAWYIVNRLKDQDKLGAELLDEIAYHIKGCSREIADIFLRGMVSSRAHPDSNVAWHAPGPDPSPRAEWPNLKVKSAGGLKGALKSLFGP